MKKLLIAVIVVSFLSACATERHDPNVRFTQKGTNYKELRHTGCNARKYFIFN